MSGMSSPPATSSAPPSAGRADDLFALAKFVMSEESQVHLKNLQESEIRAKAVLAEADDSRTRLDIAWTNFHNADEQLAKDKADFEEVSRLQTERHAERVSAVQARENEVSRREEKCNERERDLKAAEDSFAKACFTRDSALAFREAEVSGKAKELSNKEAAFERKQQAIYQAMRS